MSANVLPSIDKTTFWTARSLFGLKIAPDSSDAVLGKGGVLVLALEEVAGLQRDESPHRETDDLLLLLEENSRLRKLVVQLSNLLGDLPPFSSVTPIGGQMRPPTDHPIQKRVRNG